jgi:transcriptional regulator with XRE-family HTH domain
MNASLKMLGKNVAILREAQGLTIKDIASKAETQPATIMKLERGKLDPPFTLLLSVTRALRIPPTALLIRPPKLNTKLRARMRHFKKNKDKIRRLFEKHFIPSSSKCWEWTAHKEKSGYGRFVVYANSPDYAHRVAYELYKGPIPHAHNVHHTCGNPKCVKPMHLALKLQSENLALRNKWLLSRR